MSVLSIFMEAANVINVLIDLVDKSEKINAQHGFVSKVLEHSKNVSKFLQDKHQEAAQQQEAMQQTVPTDQASEVPQKASSGADKARKGK